jgi:hypothetical protein
MDVNIACHEDKIRVETSVDEMDDDFETFFMKNIPLLDELDS